jgi:hypothetical protein
MRHRRCKIARPGDNTFMSKRKQRPIAQPAATEPSAVETLTVGWMLSVMTTLVCELGFVAARAYLIVVAPASARIQVLAMVLLFAAFVVGSVSLELAYAVVRGRHTPPPRGILVFSVVVGAAPAATVLLRLLASGLTAVRP